MVRRTGGNFIEVEGIAKALVLSPQSAGIHWAELDTPESNCFAGDSNAAFRQEILDIPVTQVEAIVDSDGIRNDIGRKSVTLTGTHGPIRATSAS